MTLLELLTAFLITVVIAGSVWSFFRATQQTAYVSRAKGEAKSQAEIILKALEKDISASAASATLNVGNTAQPYTVVKTFKIVGSGVEMKVGEKKSYSTVTYTYAKPVLQRNGHPLSDKVEKLVFTELNDQQVAIEIEVGIIPPGNQTPQIHAQKVIVSIREAVTDNMDQKWRTSEDVKTNF